MHYWVWLQKKNGESFIHQNDFLPGIMVSEDQIPNIMAKTAEKCGLCKNCKVYAFKAHPINESGEKYCTLLFYKAIQPNWKLSQLV